MFSIAEKLFPARTRRRAIARQLHAQIIAEARRQELFGDARIKDDVDGRVAAISIFSSFVTLRLSQADEDGKAIADLLTAQIFEGFDAALRETGVGDASISRKVRKLGEAFVGIGVAVNEALAGETPKDDLEDVLIRNQIVQPEGSEAVARHIMLAHSNLMKRSMEDIRNPQADQPLFKA
ncbi:ubiquinol-cytochrome C chaperone family protein [Henriciella litoralis]|uniref:ubiquinol-cytochrome C chaperone family protein n=1 Tax=Henriciella litoralis TaxID=568102 RepID=UPI00146C1DD7|nr:ubiquinol-cytochrome C chaperone family protein [Henriciella litoralis]